MKKQICFLAIVFMGFVQFMEAQVITTLAGGSSGYANGTGSSAKFNYPGGIIIDNYGRILVADTGNNRIRVITQTGEVTTIAGDFGVGNGTTMDDGPCYSSKFFSPTAMCKDASGNIYVKDSPNRIRKISSDFQNVTTAATDGNSIIGNITGILFKSGNFYTVNSNGGVNILSNGGNFSYILAGYGYGGNGIIDGTGTSASFNQPYGICQDIYGNNYVTDTENHRIRKVTAEGIVTTFAGSTQGYVDAIGTSAKFSRPKGICIDPSGNLYVADTDYNKIRKITPNGVVTTIIQFGAQDICIDTAGNLYTTWVGSGSSFIYKITLNLDVNDNQFINNLKVYPNPTKDLLHIDLKNELSGKITDLVGKNLMNVTAKDIDVSTLSAGIYVLDIVSDGKRYTTKIIKE
jgi:hypothetical protein